MRYTKNSLLGTAATTIVLLLVFFTYATPSAQAQSAGTTLGTCSVEISSLNEGDKVGDSVNVRGMATIPADGYLWILARKKSMGNQWWPQAGGTVEVDAGHHFEAEVFFGKPRDVGSTFEVAAVVVNRQTHEGLVKWFATSKELDYPPITFPNSISSCRVVTTKVVKDK